MSEFLPKPRTTVQEVLEGKITEEEFLLSLGENPKEWATQELRDIEGAEIQLCTSLSSEGIQKLRKRKKIAQEILDNE